MGYYGAGCDYPGGGGQQYPVYPSFIIYLILILLVFGSAYHPGHRC